MAAKAVASLRNVAGSMQLVSDNVSVFLNSSTGEVIEASDEIMALVDDEDLKDRADWEIEFATEIKELLESDHCIEFPDRREIDEWSMMEKFASAVEDEHARERLLDALHGKGAFRRFKDVADRLDLLDPWYEHCNKAFEDFTRKWLQDNDIPYNDDVKTA